MNNFSCQFCKRETSNAGGNKKHEITCKENPNRLERCGGVAKGVCTRPAGKSLNQYTKAKLLGKPKPKLSNKTLEKLRESTIKNNLNRSPEIKKKKFQNP